MARPGMGGGGSRSSGGYSSSRSSGGHHVSSSRSYGGGFSRPGTSYRSSSSYWSSSGGYHHYGPTFVGGGYGRSYGPRMGCGTVITTLVVFLILFALISSMSSGGRVPASTINREPLENPVPFNNDCIIDELDFIENESKLSKELQHTFYEKTGIQPYIVILGYQPELTTDDMKTAFAEEFYETHIAADNGNEGSFLYMYFGEADPNEVGYMTYVNGKHVTSIMDDEAVNIFWSYVDRYWDDASLDGTELFSRIFSKTADIIMDKSTTGADVSRWIVIGIIIIGAGVIAIVLVSKKHKRDKEKAAETERILKTPIGDLKDSDPLLDKYSQDKN